MQRDSWRPAAADLRGVIDLLYNVQVGAARPAAVPDGRAGLVWVSDGALWAFGPQTGAWRPGRSGVSVAGARLAPGVAHAILGVPAQELRDRQIRAGDLWGRPARWMEAALAGAADESERLAVLERVVRHRLAVAGTEIDPVARLVAHRLAESSVPAGVLAAEAGLSPRQLRRRCQAAFGYSPSVLARVLRLQRFLRLASGPDCRGPLSGLAAAAGYSDQAHLARDCRQLTGFSASRLRAAVRAGWASQPGVFPGRLGVPAAVLAQATGPARPHGGP
jgi:AraC-like DNA-binding protein